VKQGDLVSAFVLANEFKEGDRLVGGGKDAQLRNEARRSLGALRLGAIIPGALIDDGISETLERALDPHLLAETAGLTVAGFEADAVEPRRWRMDRPLPQWPAQ
jgi:hypothetical protein